MPVFDQICTHRMNPPAGSGASQSLSEMRPGLSGPGAGRQHAADVDQVVGLRAGGAVHHGGLAVHEGRFAVGDGDGVDRHSDLLSVEACRQNSAVHAVKTSADVVIVGGGCMGASVAFHLARRGITDVVLVEREPFLGAGSTGRNAGGVRHQFSHEANIRLSIESIRVLEDFEARVGSPIDFNQHGYLFLLSTQEAVTAFRRNVELQRRMGIEVDWLDAAEAGARAPGLDTEGVLAATFCARDGIADPNGVTMGFANAARAAGVEICRQTQVTGIRVERGRVTGVETTQGVVATRTVVNAAGPYASEVGDMVSLDVPVLPYRRHIFIAQPPVAGSWGRRAPAPAPVPQDRIMVIDYETTFYFHREGVGLLFGMGDPDERSGFDTTVNWDCLDRVMRVAVGRVPALLDASVSNAWAGLYEMTPDAMPIIGPSTGVEGFFFITGFSGHGFQHSPAAGRILADLIAGVDPGNDVSPFAFDRFTQHRCEGEGNVV